MSISLKQCLDAFIEDCRSRGYSEGTLGGYRKDIGVFINWAWEQDCLSANDITRQLLEAYQQYLVGYRTRYGTILKPSTQKTYLMRLQSLLCWLARQGVLAYNPAERLVLPDTGIKLPQVLSVDEMVYLIASVDIQIPFGVRDRAIIETLYSTGMRGMEAANLTLDNLELETGWVMIRQGKWKKDRRLPIGDSAIDWLEQYIRYERPKAKRAAEYDNVFLTAQSRPFKSKGISALVHRYLAKARLREQGGSHLIRHSMATHMLENGADIRYIQQMLGHSDLSSTQIYTQVQDPALKDVHDKTHPAKGLDVEDEKEE